jgi:Ca2+-binding EF-hand superfamily protein
MLVLVNQATERIEAAFQRLDLDDSGVITVENLTALLGPDYDEAMVREVLDEGDLAKNGRTPPPPPLFFFFCYFNFFFPIYD